MNEEETREEKTTPPEETGVLSETAKETIRIHAETEGLNKAIAEKENADARSKIAGVSAGHTPIEEKKEETPQEYKDRILKGE